jgi:Rrf2 family iron-sulfur cluster assembly transcriptional regulator
MTMNDVFLAVNHTRSRKISINDLAKEMMDSFENYLRDCLTTISSTSSGLSARAQLADMQSLPAWDIQKHQIKEIPIKSKWDTQSVVITKAEMQKIEKLGPNSIFDFSNYLQ